jgi:hypothetical protein
MNAVLPSFLPSLQKQFSFAFAQASRSRSARSAQIVLTISFTDYTVISALRAITSL